MCKCQAPVWQGVRVRVIQILYYHLNFLNFIFTEYVSEYMCVQIFMCVCVPVCMHACGGQGWYQVSSLFTVHPIFFETNSDWIWSSPILPVWLSNKPRNPPVSATLVTGLQTHTVSQTSCGFWGLNSSPHEDMASILPAEPSPQPPYVILMVRSGLNW